MKRLDVFEFEDFKWFPDFLRRDMMEYLRHFFTLTRYYAPVAPILHQMLVRWQTDHIVDLCAGGGGPSLPLQQALSRQFGCRTVLSLTDLYPNRDSCRFHSRATPGTVRCIDDAVDATSVPQTLTGVRTIFSSIHHFDPPAVRQILSDATTKSQGIAVFDLGDRHWLLAVGIVILHPVLLVVLTPFFRPMRLSTLLFTYLIPLIPLFTVWDGVMSVLRLYEPAELLEIAKKIQPDRYDWQSGKLKNRLGLRVTYLVGFPKN